MMVRSEFRKSSQEVDIRCRGRTDMGCRRDSNQDHYLIADLHKNMLVLDSSVEVPSPHLSGEAMGKLMLVADGMGGANAGELASQMAIQEMSRHLLNSMHWLYCPDPSEVERFVEDLREGAIRSHSVVKSDGDSDPLRQGMGTTLTMAFLLWPSLYVVHIGDSRCYVLRGEELVRVTHDQTLAQLLFDKGELSESELAESPYHNVLYSAIGSQQKPEAMAYRYDLLPGDKILLCTDGLNRHVEDEEIGKRLQASCDPGTVCDELVDLANERGGIDNITVLAAYSSVDG